MHNAVLRTLGLNWCYVPLPVRPGTVGDAIRGMVALGFRGINVTVPHKRAVMPFLDEVAPEATAVGAVNTIVVERDARGAVVLDGHNTDVAGFLARCGRAVSSRMVPGVQWSWVPGERRGPWSMPY